MIGFHHVDVFTDVPYAGNSLAVFVDPPDLRTAQMERITRELRHFESIFVTAGPGAGVVHARVFDLAGELGFAGHPVLGAAAVLHGIGGTGVSRGAGSGAVGAVPDAECEWTFALRARTVRVRTRRRPDGSVSALLDQGAPQVLARPPVSEFPAIAAALNLGGDDLDASLPPEVISTGLRYLVVPVRSGGALARARIVHPDFDRYLADLGAQFAYVLDAAAVEGRHWNNDGLVEDVATGSAAGCVAAYLMRHGRVRDGAGITLAQGRFTGRPSHLAITAYGTPDAVDRVTVGGDVALVGTGTLLRAPSPDPS